MLAELRVLTPDQQRAREVMRAAIREEVTGELHGDWLKAQHSAVSQAVSIERERGDANITELRRFHAAHLREVRWGRFWMGMAAGAFAMAAVLIASMWSIGKDMILTNVTAESIAKRGSEEPPPLVIRDEPLVERRDGFQRGREPASAP